MSLFSTTHPSQPPPLNPRSPYDVSTFEALTKSLRQHPDLASETDKILNSFQLAKFVDGVRRFQSDHLGRKNKSKYWPQPRLPDPLFHTRSISGSLFTAILSAFRVKQSSPWRNFNFDNPKLYDDNIALLKKMERDLITAGILKRPRVYFDKCVESQCGVEEVQRLSRIVERFGGTVAKDEEEIMAGKVTHIVAYDPEEHDGAEMRKEEEAEDMGESGEREKKFLRTLGVFDIPIEGEGDDVKSRRMALVHWWYFPASYDEWIDADDVAGDVEKESPPTGPGGAAVVGCKFIRDVEKFNEWGVESDYAVMEFERKLMYLTNQTNKSILSTNSNKKRRASLKSERLSKKANSEILNMTDASVSTATTISEPKSLPSKGENKSNPTNRVTSERRSLKYNTMNPRRIQTGFCGVRGEAIRRTVYDGALRIDGESYRIIRDTMADFVSGGGDDNVDAPLLSAKQEWRKYLSLNALIRPSVNTSLGECIVVTELSASDQPEGGTTVTCRKARILSCPDSAVGAVTMSNEGADPMRIRGGGPDENEQGVGQPEQNEGESAFAEPHQNSTNDDQAAIQSAAAEENALEDTEQLDDIEADESAFQESTPMVTEEVQEPITEEENAADTNPVTSLGGAVDNEIVSENEIVSSESRGGMPEELPHSTQSLEAISSAGSKADEPPADEVASNTIPDVTSQVQSESPTSGNVMTANSNELCAIVSLKRGQQLSTSIDQPAISSNEETPAHRPSWYDKSKASEFEQRSLPEWFNETSTHRTPAEYICVRERILDLAKKNGHQYITATALRRSVSGDAGSIMRLHKFLTDWGFINVGVGESAPSEAKLRGLHSVLTSDSKSAKRKFSDVKRAIFWSPSRIQALEVFVLTFIDKKEGSDGKPNWIIDWDRVAAKFNDQLSEKDFVTAKECQCVFLQPPNSTPVLLPPRSAPACSQETSVSNILDKVRPEVFKKVIDAALSATQDLAEAKKASLVGVYASVAAEKGQAEEEEVKATLMDIVDQRLQRLENRAAMLEDVEALLEAERVALELERRDMYTARCRQWFGDGTS